MERILGDCFMRLADVLSLTAHLSSSLSTIVTSVILFMSGMPLAALLHASDFIYSLTGMYSSPILPLIVSTHLNETPQIMLKDLITAPQNYSDSYCPDPSHRCIMH